MTEKMFPVMFLLGSTIPVTEPPWHSIPGQMQWWLMVEFQERSEGGFPRSCLIFKRICTSCSSAASCVVVWGFARNGKERRKRRRIEGIFAIFESGREKKEMGLCIVLLTSQFPVLTSQFSLLFIMRGVEIVGEQVPAVSLSYFSSCHVEREEELCLGRFSMGGDEDTLAPQKNHNH